MRPQFHQDRVHSTPNMLAYTFLWQKHTAHWEYPKGDAAKGFASMNVEASRVGRWLQVSATEQGEKSAKKTFLTFSNPEAIRKLRDLCDYALNEKPQEGAQEAAGAANDERVNIGTTMQSVRLLARALGIVLSVEEASLFIRNEEERVELVALKKLLERCQPGSDRINDWMV